MLFSAALCEYLDLVIVPMEVLAFSLIPTKLVSTREMAFDHHFVKGRHIQLFGTTTSR